MNHSFDRDIKQKLENSTPEELGYRPDRDQLWQKISGKKKSKAIPFPLWITHAAAVAAGLLIGVFFFTREREPARTVAVTKQAQPSLPVRTVRDTVYVQEIKKTTPLPVPQTKVPQQEQVPEQEPQLAANNTLLPVPAPAPVQKETIIASNTPQPRKVLHLSDMDNENAIPKTGKPHGPAFFAFFSNQNQPETNQETLSMLVNKQFMPSKNQPHP